MRFVIDKTWEGRPLEASEAAEVDVTCTDDSVIIEVDAPYHGDPAPQPMAGRLDRLWEHEVVELFLLGDHDHYLEVEMGPHGHYLVLQLCGPRQVERRALLVGFEAVIGGDRWHGRARFPATYLPANTKRGNAYRIYGSGDDRRYLAAYPVPGERADFHRLECFGDVTLF
ncbi:MAG: hypothetical protein V3T05_07985 [Myxococcota bacterium]